MILSLSPSSFGRGKREARRIAAALALAGAVAALAGCGGGDTTEAAPAEPTRYPTVVSLNPCTDAILAQVTGPGQLLAISSYSHDPESSSMPIAEARRYRAVSGTVEEVARIHPQVVVASAFLDPASEAAFRRLGYRLVKMPIASDLAAAREQVRELARLTGHAAEGERLVARIDAAVARNAPPASLPEIPALVWESGGLVAGDRTLIVDMMRHTGFTNIAGARGLSQADYLPLEQVLADPPRVVFAVGDPLAEEDRMLHHPALSALKSTRRFLLSRSILWCGGPTIPGALDELGEARREYLSSRPANAPIAARTVSSTP
ncbi:MAG: iron ABC transporter substrate-binding protein [Novosphingobium pentaromativorans]|uniref:Iron ABC transporter substrate-binding protein n=1 Tax=Novosphingobium pentaromativorans TaxID=205844 RepID=A0A2W5NR52_9SPHN|nr:MAG: iron ABC transporter substrate-binding protein [Novosphingobium pentaromativorans]